MPISGSTPSGYAPGYFVGSGGAGYPYSSSTSTKVVGLADSSPVFIPPCDCGNLTTPNSICSVPYDQSSPGATCFDVQADNVTIDCNGHSLTSNNTLYTYGVYSGQYGTTVRDCNISGFGNGIFFYGASYGDIENDGVSDYAVGAGAPAYNGAVVLTGASHNTLEGVTAYASGDTNSIPIFVSSGSDYNTLDDFNATSGSGFGLMVWNGADYNSFSNFKANSTYYGIFLKSYTDGNNFTNFTAYGNSYGILFYISPANDQFANFNATGGVSGILLYPGSGSNGNTLHNFNASGGIYGIDSESSSYNNTYTNFNATSSGGYGVYDSSSSYDNFSDFSASSPEDFGIYSRSSSYETYSDFNASGYYAVYMESTTYSNFSKGYLSSDSNGHAAYIFSSSTGNTFSNNTFVGCDNSGSQNGSVYLDSGSTGNTFYWNDFTDTPDFYVQDANAPGSNFYNATTPSGSNEGNLWYNLAVAGRVLINGSNASAGFPLLYTGSGGPAYPYNDSNSNGKTLGVADYAPLTPYNGPFPCMCGDNITTPNSNCTLVTDQSIGGANCITVAAENVTINCNGHSMTGDNTSGTYGIYSDQFNTTIENCNIGNFSTAIGFDGATNGLVSNSTVSTSYPSDSATNGMGILLTNNADANMIANTAAAAGSNAILLDSSSNNIISNATAAAAIGDAIQLDSGSGNTIDNTTATAEGGTTIYIYSSTYDNIVDTSATGSTGSGIDLDHCSNELIEGSSGTTNSNYHGILIIRRLQQHNRQQRGRLPVRPGRHGLPKLLRHDRQQHGLIGRAVRHVCLLKQLLRRRLQRIREQHHFLDIGHAPLHLLLLARQHILLERIHRLKRPVCG